MVEYRAGIGSSDETARTLLYTQLPFEKGSDQYATFFESVVTGPTEGTYLAFAEYSLVPPAQADEEAKSLLTGTGSAPSSLELRINQPRF